jgi:hypothetical protein
LAPGTTEKSKFLAGFDLGVVAMIAASSVHEYLVKLGDRAAA